MMGTEIVPETSVSSCNQLTRLCAREDFIVLMDFGASVDGTADESTRRQNPEAHHYCRESLKSHNP
jgi:hypothetical protein